MAINFPSSPTTGQVYEYQSIRWRWNGSAWDKYEVFTFNGLTANVEGVGSYNGLTGAVQGVSSFGGKTGTVGAGITTGQILYWMNNDVAGSNNFTFDGTDIVTLAETGHFTGRLLGPVLVPIKNTSGVVITKSTPVYVTGSVGASGVVEVAACDASNSAKMPSIGLADSTLAINGIGHAVVFGNLESVDTSAYAYNQTVYVAPGGGITGIKPTGANDLIQNIGRVIRVQSNTGDILVSAIGRSNDVPNIVKVVSYLQMPDGMTATGLVRSLNGLTADITLFGGSGIGVSSGGKGITVSNTGVLSFNGLTGAVTGVTTSVANTFTALQTFNSGISAAGVSAGIISNVLNIYGRDRGNTAGLTLIADPNTTLVNPVYIALSKGGASDTGSINVQAGTINVSSATSVLGAGDPTIVLDVFDIDALINRKATIGSGTLTANRSYTFPDASGTFVLDTNISSSAVTSYNGRVGAVQGVSAAVAGIGISVSGATGSVTITNTGVQSFNGLTGAVSGVTTSVANTFTALQTFNSGISAAGATFTGNVAMTSTSSHTGLASFAGGITTSGITLNGRITASGLGTFNAGITTSGITLNGNLVASGSGTFNSGVLTDFIVPLVGFNNGGTLHINADETGVGGGGATTYIGDVGGDNNNTYIAVDDSFPRIILAAPNNHVLVNGALSLDDNCKMLGGGYSTANNTANQIIFSYDGTSYCGGEITITVQQGAIAITSIKTCRLLIANTAGTVNHTEYGETVVGTDFVTFDVSISGGLVIVSMSPTGNTALINSHARVKATLFPVLI